MAFAHFLALDPTFGIHSNTTLDTDQPCRPLKPMKNEMRSEITSLVLLSGVKLCFFVVCFVFVLFFMSSQTT